MKKETFVMGIEALQEQYEADSVFGENMVRCFPYADPTNLMPGNNIVNNALLGVLQEEMCDSEQRFGHSWIEWWMFDADFGKTAEAYDANKKRIPMSTPELLYDFLIENKNK